MRLGDLDGDLDLDVLVLLDYPGGVLTLLNDGAAGLTSTGTTFPTAYGVRNLAVGDFDGDQQLDCAVLTGSVGTRLAIGWGRGDGTFDPPTTNYPANVYGSGLEAGDFDGDGELDLVAGHKYGLSFFAYQGSRTFSVTAVGGGNYNKGLATADLDGNGTLDLVATFGTGATIRFLSNDGSGSFSQIAAYPSGVQGYALATGDWNGDGSPDAVSADYDGSLAKIWTAVCGAGTYCVAKTNSQGCVPSIAVSGPPLTVWPRTCSTTRPGFFSTAMQRRSCPSPVGRCACRRRTSGLPGRSRRATRRPATARALTRSTSTPGSRAASTRT